ncbi:hypothetical protein CC86DRAFT_371054 [Ophiobolus disseminans]|uniref:Uncharacterized protein n=1 Tax=Ophiobolus disseminans TaxID=1469910 RepID=A0A6A6ZWZ0_9PLEO|nr:hypothetical protein CC86DRAFT_371054 [Ophiobolus disseminans]
MPPLHPPEHRPLDLSPTEPFDGLSSAIASDFRAWPRMSLFSKTASVLIPFVLLGSLWFGFECFEYVFYFCSIFFIAGGIFVIVRTWQDFFRNQRLVDEEQGFRKRDGEWKTGSVGRGNRKEDVGCERDADVNGRDILKARDA